MLAVSGLSKRAWVLSLCSASVLLYKMSAGLSCERAVLTSLVLEFLCYRPHPRRRKGKLSFPHTFWMGSKNTRTSLVAKTVKSLPAMQQTRVQYLGQDDPLEKGMTEYSSIIAWRTPWTERGWSAFTLRGLKIQVQLRRRSLPAGTHLPVASRSSVQHRFSLVLCSWDERRAGGPWTVSTWSSHV